MLLLCYASGNSQGYEAEKTAITQLLMKESNFAAGGDKVNWPSCWANTDDIALYITSADGMQSYHG